MNTQQPNSTNDLIEAIAEIEHEQWMHWSQSVAPEVSMVTNAKWQKSWIAYNDLTDELKEADRLWARKVVLLLREWRLTPEI
jgi:hypothetical protein